MQTTYFAVIETKSASFAQATAPASRKAVTKHRVFHLEKCSKVAIIPLEKCNEMVVIRSKKCNFAFEKDKFGAMLRRKIETVLAEWKRSKERKPLVIKGVRQSARGSMWILIWVLSPKVASSLSSTSVAMSCACTMVLVRSTRI